MHIGFFVALSLATSTEGFTPRPALPRQSFSKVAIRSSPLVAASPGAPKPALLAEALGTGLITLLGTGCVSAAVFTGAHSGVWQIAATWGAAVTIAAYTTAGVSGAHLNPAVTLALVAFKGFPLRRAVAYIVAQVVGAVVAALGVLLAFGPAIIKFEAAKSIVRSTAAGLASAPGCMFFSLCPGGVSSGLVAAALEALQMAVLMFAILSFTHEDGAAPDGAAPALIGLTVAALISVFGPLTCAGFNPARDIGPRIVASLAGWGGNAFKHWWCYAVGPLVGGLAGAAAHHALYEQ